MESISSKQKILFAIPAHNEEAVILDVVTNISSATQSIQNTHNHVVVFDDASTDKTRTLLQSHGFEVHTIPTHRGLGYVFSQIVHYFLKNDFDILVTIDGDGQFDPQDIKEIITPLQSGEADMTTGSRFMNTSETLNISRIKSIGNKIGARYISSVLNKKYYDVTCGFRGYTRDAIFKVHTFSDFTYTQEVFLNLGFKKVNIKEIPIKTTYFKKRKSKMVTSVFSYMFKSFKIIFKSILIYSPMRLFGVLALFLAILAIISGIFVLFWNMHAGTVTPFKWVGVTSVTSIVLGTLLYCIGVLLQITSRIQLTLEEQLYLTKKLNSGNEKK